MRSLFFLIIFLNTTLLLHAQTTFPVNGPEDQRDGYYAFVHATISIDYKTCLNNASMVIHKGFIEALGKDIPIPSKAIVINCNGRFIYPSFIEAYSNYGMPMAQPRNSFNTQPQFVSTKKGAYDWNEAIRPETQAQKLFSADEEKAKDWRTNGFGAVCAHVQDGIARGTSVLVSTGKGRENELIVQEQCTANYSFSKGSSTQDYPSSLMGVIALLRQTYLDAQWYIQKKDKTEVNLSLQAWNDSQTLPQVMDVSNKLNELRALKVAKEFNKNYIIKGNGDEYQWLEEMKKSGVAFIIPINFPKPYDVSDAYNTLNIPLSSMKHWELAPYNPARLEKAGIDFALTTQNTTFADFNKNLRAAIDKGLSRVQALKSLTYTPANLLKVYEHVGSLEKGKVANFLILSDTLFTSNAVLLQHWVQGKQYIINNDKQLAIKGIYSLPLENRNFNLKIEGRPGSMQANVSVGDTNYYKADIQIQDNLVTLMFPYPKDSAKSVYRLNGTWNGNSSIAGEGQNPQGVWVAWTAQRTGDVKPPKPQIAPKKDIVGNVIYPFMAYGNDSLPKADNILFKNATVWTNEADGIITEADVWVADGKIKAVGKNLTAPGARVIDCTGKHITSGIIDEHSHIAISQGVNEGTQSVTSEVRIGDVVNSEDINIYRQLSGGVTCAHLLHGSANTIGGQTQLIKLRWGRTPEELKFEAWPGFIKFALGENVKQANWGDNAVYRYPQTRMGVEQTLYDAFKRARDYDERMKEWSRLSEKLKLTTDAPRRDLKLEALVEILNDKRFITCHSYVQSEINMLMHVADSMHFKMNTFTHILEGYKVADKMKAHGVYASTFADWWAYKNEVVDAIPYNAAILTKMGIPTAINSDDAEMGRRLNQEAAKSIKYGGLTQEEAWKLCTLNPAIMLHVSDKVGSLKPGKDADIVIWSDNPLSIYAKVEATYIDGACYYSIEKDKQLRQYITTERQRLIAKMLQARQRGEGVQTLQLSVEDGLLWDCDTVGVWVR